MLEVQKLHAECNTQESFLENLKLIGVDVRDYPEHKLWLLDYNMIECVKNHPVVNECRGLVMSYSGEIVRKGFNRFYNLGENGVDTFDFENSVAFEKADGSLMFVYYCKATSRWEIGTRGTAFAEGPNEWHGTFRNFMLAAMGRTEAEFQVEADNNLWRNMTYLFEAIGPDNRIVTPYKENMLVFLGALNPTTGQESLDEDNDYIDLFASMKWNVRKIREYKFNTQAECMVALNALTGLEEGYVVYNKLTMERVKVKNATYLAAHRLRGNGLTLNSICELVAMNEVDEYVAVFPEDKEKFEPAQFELAQMEVMLRLNYEEFKDLETQKDFALAVKDLPLSGVMFKARKNGTDVIHEFNQFPVNKRAEWLKERLIEGKKYE